MKGIRMKRYQGPNNNQQNRSVRYWSNPQKLRDTHIVKIRSLSGPTCLTTSHLKNLICCIADSLSVMSEYLKLALIYYVCLFFGSLSINEFNTCNTDRNL